MIGTKRPIWLMAVKTVRVGQICSKRFQSTKAAFKSNQLPTQTSTVNENELRKFRQLSQKWWTGTECLALRNMNQLRVPFVVEAFQSKFDADSQTMMDSSKLLLDGVKLLDIGCGGGILAEALARVGANVTAIDPIEENVESALAHAKTMFTKNPEKIPNYKCCTIEELSSQTENVSNFDGIIASEVLEHVDNLEKFLQCSLACLRPGGFFFVTTINQTPISYLTTIVAGENILGLLPKGTHQYSKYIPPKAFSLVLNDFNCEVIKIHGMFLNPLTMHWSWTQNQWVNYALLAVKNH